MAMKYVPTDQEINNAIEVANRIPLKYEPYQHDTIKHNPGGMTLKEIGVVIGVSPEGVRQIINKAFKKLRRKYER